MITPINLGRLQSDLDCAGFDLLNFSGGVPTQHVFYPESYGAIGDGTTDDTTALQACITAAVAVTGTVRLSPVTYKVTTALVVNGSMAIEGSGMFPQNGPVGITNNESLMLPYVSPYIKGSVILQAGAAQNGITINVTGTGVNLRDFGIRFADAIKFSNTGHGIFCEGAAYAGKKDSGLTSSLWSNLGVYGHDGNHYAFHFTNAFCCTFDHLTGWGGGGIRMEAKWAICCSGNSVFINPYFATCVAGTAHGFHLKSDSGNTRVILTVFIRPQSAVISLTDIGITPPPTSAQNTFRIDPDTGTGIQTPYVDLIAPDMETNVSAVTSGVYGKSTVNVGGGLVDGNTTHWAEVNYPMVVNNTVTASSMITAAMKLPAVPVASLPGSPVIGQLGCVSDGTASLAWGATVTGGGSTKYLVWYNGANWTVAGK